MMVARAATTKNIKGTTPPAGTRLAVDSNIWIAFASPYESDARFESYLDFLKRALDNKVTLVAPHVTFGELARHIESGETDRFSLRTFGSLNKTNKKALRTNEAHWKTVTDAIRDAWEQVLGVAELPSKAIPRTALHLTEDQWMRERIDGMDAVILADMRHNDLGALLTDDRDFGAAAGVTVYTANRRLLE